MISEKLADALNAPREAPAEVAAALRAVPSQTSLEEREGLYAAARWHHKGEGQIFDIGCAAGGSTYCLAAGLRDSGNEAAPVQAFDLFDGYSLRTFAAKLPAGAGFPGDEALFDWVTRDVQPFVARNRVDLTRDFGAHTQGRRVEVAHIDAAKTLELWRSIVAGLAPTVIPGRTLWIFQDFERARLPWQIYGLSVLSRHGEFIGGCHYGSMYFRFREAMPPADVDKLASDRFTLAERVQGVESVMKTVADDHADVLEAPWSLESLERALIAFCHFHFGNREEARALYRTVEESFRTDPMNRGFERELFRRR